jgi:hypothetical protein
MNAPQGWFPDPERPGRLRYFDGTVWTEHYAPETPPPAAEDSSPTPTPTKFNNPQWVKITAIVFAVLGFIAGARLSLIDGLMGGVINFGVGFGICTFVAWIIFKVRS